MMGPELAGGVAWQFHHHANRATLPSNVNSLPGNASVNTDGCEDIRLPCFYAMRW
jgi:hypothetical protein